MNANELRIGNWVKYFELYCKVGSIKLDNTAYYLYSYGKTMTINIIGAYEPIPLTPEILEKCLFVTHDEQKFIAVMQVHPKLNSLYFVWNRVDKCVYLEHAQEDEKASDLLIQYLHQLQNLYFSLTGEELKIEL